MDQPVGSSFFCNIEDHPILSRDTKNAPCDVDQTKADRLDQAKVDWSGSVYV
jgi:hypothetical protein